MTFLSKENSIGYYNGKIVFFATDGTVNETFELPITVEVIAFVFAPPLTVNPELWNESVQAGDTVSQEFMVCTNIYTALSSVEFIPSALPPGTWVWDTTPLSAMGRGTCRPKVLKITVPGGTEPGKYTGSIQVVGQGSDKAKDTISVSILVGGDPGDSIGPNVTDVTHSPSKLYTMEPVNFLITASDKNRGNNTIKGCEFRANGGNWTVMEAVDGDFNSMTEFAKISHSGFSTLGDHNVSFRCTDYRDNVGPVRNYTVSTMKNFLFVIKGTTPSSSEQTWLTWMDTHDSLQGFGWDYDINTDNNVSAGSVNLSYYSAVLMSDYTAPSGIGAPLQTYRNNGGRVLLIGSALDQGPRDLGLTSEPGTQGSNLGILVITFLHYVTQEYDANETVIIYIGSGGSRAVKDSFIGEWLAVDDSNHNAIMLGEHAGYLLWGPKTADVLNNEGYRITANCLDYSVLQSTIMPG
jgi:hypothetical protein